MEKAGYREIYEHLRELFPDKVSISVKQAAGVLGVSVGTVYCATRRVKNPLPCVRVGPQRVIIPISSLARWMA